MTALRLCHNSDDRQGAASHLAQKMRKLSSRPLVRLSAWPRPQRRVPRTAHNSLQQAAVIYGVSVDTLRRRISAGKLPASRFGARLIRVRVQDLERLYRPNPIGDQLARWRRS